MIGRAAYRDWGALARRVRCVGSAVAVLALSLLAPAVTASWSVTYLNPPGLDGANGSFGYGIGAGQQVGYLPRSANIGHAALWTGSAASWVNLHPGGAWFSSYAHDADGGQQVGYVEGWDILHAALWSGSAASFVDLHPSGWFGSTAWGISGGQQVGYVYSWDLNPRAGRWSGSASSFVQLHPAGWYGSVALGTHGGQQVGYVFGTDYVRYASLWNGTAASWLNLNPAGSTYSEAFDTFAGQQVGYARVGGVNRAALWNGTAGSWVDLHPAGAAESKAHGLSSGIQVGYARFGNNDRAAAWFGSAGSFVDLHAFLPADFSISQARDVWQDGSLTYVVGYGLNTTRGRFEAVMWIIPEPASLLGLCLALALMPRRR